MENEKGLYVALGVYIGELQKRADLKNDEIRKSVHIGHSTFNDLKKGAKRPLSDYVKVVECCLDAFNEEEAGVIWDEWRRMYFRYRRRKEEERGER
ncbi:hypothetical protein NXW25_10700 [Bacteroides ovatus]|uniref:hypothetical protein n=1 Tax=Bacteroides xylanisolvens TaxID=371601 RepID=UPI002161925C|nr:hypothetical protein [Bacteroides xylanisolvens]MCS3137269.1 hypothetical protein [Bacteroides ovatus]UVP23338.1 hypothetical protein NXX95_20330 [Bacteroides xylanisolvens]